MFEASREISGRVSQRRYGDFVVLVALFLFHTINNWIWAVSNVTLLGWDRSSHLAKTLVYNDMLQEITVRALFTALTWPWNRPPLPFLTAVPFYRLFGVSIDAALTSNCVYIAILTFSVYSIGRMLYSRRVGLLATVLTSFYPILFGLSRLSYVGYALTAMVSLTICLLLKTEGFSNRRRSLLFGVGLGLGLLTKWPFIAFVGAPVAYVALTSGAVRDIVFIPWRGSEGGSRTRRLLTSPWVHVVVAFVLCAAWYLPNWDRLPEFLLGRWLLLSSWILLVGTFYVLSRKACPGTNLLSALMVGGAIASVWALPNLGFTQRFVSVAFGGVNLAHKEELSLLDPGFYGRYLGAMAGEQLTPLYFSALVLAGCLLAWRGLKRTPVLRGERRVSDGTWICVLWFGVPLLVYTLSQTWSSRFDVALLPAAALLTAHGLAGAALGRARTGVISLLVLCGIGQFFILSYDHLYWIAERAVFTIPVLGDFYLLGDHKFVMPPSTGRTDPRYWVAPQVLEFISSETTENVALALLVNDIHLNADILRYLTLLEFEGVEVRDLARDESGGDTYSQLLTADYVLLTSGEPYRLSESAAAAVRRLRESPELFDQAYELKQEYEFPDGQVLSLYGKRALSSVEEIRDCYGYLATGLEMNLGPGDPTLLDGPRRVEMSARFCHWNNAKLDGQEQAIGDVGSLDVIGALAGDVATG